MPDDSQVPAVMIPNPDLSKIPVARERTFVFGRGGKTAGPHRETTGEGPWGISVDGGGKLDANYNRISAAPKFGTREVWHLVNDGGGWDHPIHIHFEEGQILARNGSCAQRAAGGARAQGRLPPAPERHGDDHDAVPRLGRDVHGALPQHHARGQRDAAAVGDQRRRRPFLRPLPTPIPTPQGVTFEDPD